MRLLLDQNLSPRLVTVLVDLYPGSTHVQDAGLQAADDDTVWRRPAWVRDRVEGCRFPRAELLAGAPAQGNLDSARELLEEVVAILRDHHAEMLVFERDEEGSFLALG